MTKSGPKWAQKSGSWYKNAPVLGLCLWICMWLNLNSGFWNIETPQTVSDWQLLIRAILPFAVLPLAILFLLQHQVKLPKASPSRLLIIYGSIAAVATVFSPEPLWSAYWAVAFLGTILAAWTCVDRRNPVESTRLLLYATWGATFIVASVIGYKSGSVVFGDSPTAYGILNDLHGLSRSSGVARWAAVPGLVCIVRAFHSRKVVPIAFYLSAAAVAFFIVYRMQSRGAVFGSAAALIFILLVSSRMRRYALPFAVVAMVAIFTIETPEMVSQNIDTYLHRGQSEQEFLSMSGRTRAYREAMYAIEDAPILGRGMWADRLTIGEHSHNSYLQALLNGGIFGGIPYIASWIAGWILFLRVQKRRLHLDPRDRLSVLECGTVMMFFTVRSMPETTTASFSVDLLVMVAIYAYLEALSNARRSGQRVGVIRRRIVVPVTRPQIPQAS